MSGPAARILTCAALGFAVAAGALAQEPPPKLPPPSALLSEQQELAHETAAVAIDGEALFSVRGFSGYPAQQRARLIVERIEAIALDASVPHGVQVAASPEGLRLAAGKRFLMAVVEADARLEDVDPETIAGVYAQRIEQAEGAEGLRAADVARRLLRGVRDQRVLRRPGPDVAALLAAAPEHPRRVQRVRCADHDTAFRDHGKVRPSLQKFVEPLTRLLAAVERRAAEVR